MEKCIELEQVAGIASEITSWLSANELHIGRVNHVASEISNS